MAGFGQALGAKAYVQNSVSAAMVSADPHQTVVLLFEGVLRYIHEGRDAMVAGNVPAKCSQLSKAMRILEEGLKASLDPAGGEIARNLEDLYDYCLFRLMMGNSRNDVAALDEVTKLLSGLLESWRAIRPQVTGEKTRDAAASPANQGLVPQLAVA